MMLSTMAVMGRGQGRSEMTRQDILSAISAEREAQVTYGWSQEHDESHTELEWGTILLMQLGKASDTAFQVLAARSIGSTYTAKYNQRRWRERLIAIAAVCVAALEAAECNDEPAPVTCHLCGAPVEADALKVQTMADGGPLYPAGWMCKAHFVAGTKRLAAAIEREQRRAQREGGK